MNNEKSLRVLLWLAAVGVFMQTLDSTIVNTALPAMAASLGESPLRMQSVVIAYSLAMATLIPASGWIADRVGTRRTFLAAIVLFSVGSLLCAYSRTLWQLVGSRVIQGIGGAMLLPVGRLAVLRAFPRDRFLQAMSFVAVPGMIGPLIVLDAGRPAGLNRFVELGLPDQLTGGCLRCDRHVLFHDRQSRGKGVRVRSRRLRAAGDVDGLDLALDRGIVGIEARTGDGGDAADPWPGSAVGVLVARGKAA